MPIKVTVTKSDRDGKKYKAVFSEPDGRKLKTTHFGATGYKDYTIGATDEQKKAYRARHSGDNLKDKMSPGALSYYILWSKRSFREALSDYKNRFKLK